MSDAQRDNAKRESQVEKQMNLLEKEIHALSEKQSVFEERLRPVLTETGPPAVGQDQKEVEQLVEVAARLRQCTDCLKIQHQRWCDTLSRLEL